MTTILTAGLALLVSAPALAGVPVDVSTDGASCPGPVGITISGLTPGGFMVMIGSEFLDDTGTVAVPAGACAGTLTGLSARMTWMGPVPDMDADGTISFNPTLNAGLCGKYVAALDMSTCIMSAPLELPPLSGAFVSGKDTGDMYLMNLDMGTMDYVCTLDEPVASLWGGDGRLFGATNNRAVYPDAGGLVEIDPATCATLNGPTKLNLDGYGWSESGTRGVYTGDGTMIVGVDQGCDGVVEVNADDFTVTADLAGFCHSRWNIMQDDDGNLYTNDHQNINSYDRVYGETLLGSIPGDPYGSQSTAAVSWVDGRLIKLTADTWDYPPTIKAYEIDMSDPYSPATIDIDLDLSMFSGSERPHGIATP